MIPDETPEGIITFNSVLVHDCIVTEAPLKKTYEVAVNPVPVIVIRVFSGPEVGEKFVIVCDGVHVVGVETEILSKANSSREPDPLISFPVHLR